MSDDGQLLIANRIREARSLCSLSRTAFCSLYGLNYHTIQSWEIGRSLSRETSLLRFCHALAQEGIICTEDWLLDGIGQPPFRLGEENILYAQLLTQRRLHSQTENVNEQKMNKEAAFFLSNNLDQNPVVVKIMDDKHTPLYLPGDYVGGFLISDIETAKSNGKVYLKEEDFGCFRLFSYEDVDGSIEDEKIYSIVWQRRFYTSDK